jgi:anti-sigma regulatory factor (Ser/Thr protein kinase)
MEGQGSALSPSGGRRLEMRVPAAPIVLSRVRQALGDLGLPPRLLDDARLLVNELVSNSIRHAGLGPDDMVRIRADWSGTRLRVDVYDRAGAPAPARVAASIGPSAGAESGWGLYLVDRLASRWGAAPGNYWFELDLEQSGDGGA